MKYGIEEIARITGGRPVINKAEAQVSLLLTDSRKLLYPEESLFFAIRTKTGDGHKYIQALKAAGVRNFVVKQLPENHDDGCNYILCDDSITALQRIAAYHRSRFNIPVIAITGSNGKTVVKEWLYQMLCDRVNICRSPKSYNSQIGVPLSLWQLEEKHRLGIFEAGISTTGEMCKLQEMIKPTLCIFTNLSDAHDEGFESREEKLREKLKLARSSKMLVFRKKYGIGKTARETYPSIGLASWDFDDETADFNFSIKASDSKSCTVTGTHNGERFEFVLPFSDEASLENAMHCIVCCYMLGYSPKLDTLEHIEMRLMLLEGIHGCTIIDDSYNSDMNSVAMALDFMAANAEHKELKRTVIISDINTGGKDESEIYGLLAGLLENKGVDRLIGIGDSMKRHSGLFKCKASFYPSARKMLAADEKFGNEIILVKGARHFAMESIVAALEKKQHETVMEIDLDALVHNFKQLRSQIRPETKAMAMIKADAYGCGDLEVAKTLAHHHCDYFGVAVTDEGVELRKAGIASKIIVMDPEPSCFERLIAYNLEPEIYSFRLLSEFAKEADRQGVLDYPVHIKIDTGMHRLGFMPEEAGLLAACLKSMPTVKVASVFSHLAAADDPAYDDFTIGQLKKFEQCTGILEQTLGYGFIRHILNTAGTWRFPEYQMEMVRMGIGLYGVGLSPENDIRNIATLKTIILQIKQVRKNETVGYNRNGVLDRDSLIAAIPIGYADGLDRAFGNRKGYALVHGQKAPFIGNICMDVCMIDVTDIAGVQEGDEVVIFGDKLPVSELAEKTGTIPYEILTKVSKRVKRVYFSD